MKIKQRVWVWWFTTRKLKPMLKQAHKQMELDYAAYCRQARQDGQTAVSFYDWSGYIAGEPVDFNNVAVPEGRMER